MKKSVIPFRANEKLILVEAYVKGPRGTASGRFALDTGSSMTTVTPELLDLVGYSARDGIRSTHVENAIGQQAGYMLSLAAFESLGFTVRDLAVHALDLGNLKLDGVLGLNFLLKFDLEILPLQEQIIAAQAKA